MNRFESITRPLMWLMTLLPFVFVAGCLSGIGNNDNSTPSSAKVVSAYSLSGNAGVVNEPAKSITVGVPFGTPVTALVATFTSSGAGVKVGTATQTSTATANDFTSPVTYTITAADGSTVAYTVTVVAAAASANAISAYSFVGYPGATGTVGKVAPYAILVVVPSGTSRAALVATFTTNGASVRVGATTQASGTTANDFTSPVTYTVTAADGTTATYTVTVNVAIATSKAISAFSFVGYSGSTGTITGSSSPYAIAVTIPYGTGRSALIANFTTTGTVVKVGTATQTSATTANNFSSPVAYIVTAADSTTATYNVTVTVGAASAAVVCTGEPNCVDLGTSANYVIFGKAGVTNVPTSTTTGNIGTAAAASTITGFSLIADSTNVFSTSSQVTGNVYAVDYAVPTPTAVGTASNDMLTAYTAANAVGGGAGVGSACPNVGNFGAQAIPPGVYACAGVTIPSNFTLAGTGAATDIWVFKLTGTLGMTGGAGMTFTGTQGALPQNVFWQVAGAVSIGAGSTLEGVVLGATNIDTLAGSTVHGRLLAQTAVNLQGGTNVVTKP